MFSYYGSKSKIVKFYPEPQYDTIIEPFAGSARYSLKYWDRNVLLMDTSPYVSVVWKYLIAASEKDILRLPIVESKVSLDTIKSLSVAERYLIGFYLCRGKAKPRTVGHGQNSWVPATRRAIANDLYKIRHWNFVNLSYETLSYTGRATYFVDPPYKSVQERAGNSDRYPEWQVNYPHLADWCSERDGQVIVCETSGATWLPFRELVEVNANTNGKSVKKNKEMIWTNDILSEYSW